MKKLTEYRYCNNCLCYAPKIAVVNYKLCDTGGECLKEFFFGPPKLIPSKVDGKCEFWESKDRPFIFPI